MYTDKVGLDAPHAPHTHRVKSLSRLNPMCHSTGGSLLHVFFFGGMSVDLFVIPKARGVTCHRKMSCVLMLTKRGKGIVVGEVEAEKKAKTTPDVSVKSLSEKFQTTLTSKSPFRKQAVIRQNILFV